jgi:aryl-alcohol dehydrogenase-like predicted oxidoreductase
VTIATKFGIPASPWLERFPLLMYPQRATGLVARRMGMLATSTEKSVRMLTPAAAERSLTDSLKALRTDWLDILFVHEPLMKEEADVYGLAEWLSRQKSSGRVRHVGLAGNAANCAFLMRRIEGVFDLLQVEDSLEKREADVVAAAGLPLQVTFGYMRRSGSTSRGSIDSPDEPISVMRRALARNRTGMVLVSSRKASRLRALALLTDQESSP